MSTRMSTRMSTSVRGSMRGSMSGSVNASATSRCSSCSSTSSVRRSDSGAGMGRRRETQVKKRLKNDPGKKRIHRPRTVIGGRKKRQGSHLQNWRLYDVRVPFDEDDTTHGHGGVAVWTAAAAKLGIVKRADSDSVQSFQSQRSQSIHNTAVTVVRKSFDSRKEISSNRSHKETRQTKHEAGRIAPCWRYILDLDLAKIDDQLLRSEFQKRLMLSSAAEPVDISKEDHSAPSLLPQDERSAADRGDTKSSSLYGSKRRVVVVGAGPSGLLAALTLAKSGASVTIIERGKPVEARGKDIGKLFVRKILSSDSNLCFGEGGAGTWSDGKLTTRIGRNSTSVKSILKLLKELGAPSSIVYDGKPHIGTDNMVRILRVLRGKLTALGVHFKFDSRVIDIVCEGSRNDVVTGVKLSDGSSVMADAVIMAIGHSARDLYRALFNSGVQMSFTNFAAGFRMEHPQAMVNEIQYGTYASQVLRGKGPIPVADYSYVYHASGLSQAEQDNTDTRRDVYSFCMCPGGQIVPSSTDPHHVCVNGMSFSKRTSKWANAAIVAQIKEDDISHEIGNVSQNPLAGVLFQERMEERAAEMGGGDLVVPVQTLPDFLDGKLSDQASLPTSSYRLGVKSARLDLLYPSSVTSSIRAAIQNIDTRLPGLLSDQGLLHGVETRTSSPVRIDRDTNTLMSLSHSGLYPCGEGAGYAGGIVSAAADGIQCASAALEQLQCKEGVA